MPDLVADFVEQLFQLERAEHDVGSTLVAGDELPRRPAPPAQELLARLGEALALRRPAFHFHGAGGVGERSQHAGHVLERGVFRAALLESARGLALEVEDEPLAFAAKHLSEMEVAVLADPHSARLRGRERPDPLFEKRLCGPDLRNPAPPLKSAALDTKRRSIDFGTGPISVGTVRGSFPETSQALRDTAPIIAFGRPYTVDFGGWADDFSTTGSYDAVGGFSRTINVFNAFDSAGFVPLVDRLSNFQSTVRTNQFKRCPGASEEPAPDGSNVPSAAQRSALDCLESARATGPIP